VPLEVTLSEGRVTGYTFERCPPAGSPLTESNRRPSPYHRHGRPPRAPCLHRKPARAPRMPAMHTAITAPVPRPVPRTTDSGGRRRSRCATAARCPALHGRPSGPPACPCSSASSGTEVPAACLDSSAIVKMLAGEAGSELAAQLRDRCDTAVASRQAYPEVPALAAGRNHEPGLQAARPPPAGPGGILIRDPLRRAHQGNFGATPEPPEGARSCRRARVAGMGGGAGAGCGGGGQTGSWRSFRRRSR
jgi:hypothetical protein